MLLYSKNDEGGVLMNYDGKEESWQYKIGRTTLTGILPALLPFLLLGGISVWLYLSHNGIFIFTGLFSCILLIILLAILYRSLFIKNWIGEQGIYHQSKPGNGHYYPYNEITKAHTLAATPCLLTSIIPALFKLLMGNLCGFRSLCMI